MPEKDLCLRCGKCCISELGGIKKRCPRLFLENGVWSCSIYNHRLGTTAAVIHNRVFRCGLRENQEKIIEGCPYNSIQKIKPPSS